MNPRSPVITALYQSQGPLPQSEGVGYTYAQLKSQNVHDAMDDDESESDNDNEDDDDEVDVAEVLVATGIGMSTNMQARKNRARKEGMEPNLVVLANNDYSMDAETEKSFRRILFELLDDIISHPETPGPLREFMKTIRDRGAGRYGLFRQLAFQLVEIALQKEFDFPAMMEAFMYHHETYEGRFDLVDAAIDEICSVVSLDQLAWHRMVSSWSTGYSDVGDPSDGGEGEDAGDDTDDD